MYHKKYRIARYFFCPSGDGFLSYLGDKTTNFGKELRFEAISYGGLKDSQDTRAPVFNQPRAVEWASKIWEGRENGLKRLLFLALR